MMPKILSNEKFAALALVRASRADFPAPLNLGGDAWALVGPPVDIGRLWRERIGSIHGDRIADANLWFVAKRPSRSPEVLDQENKDLKDEVWHLFLGLLVLGSPFYEGGYLLTGAHVDGAPNVRQYSEIHQYLVSFDAHPLIVGQPEIVAAARVKGGLRGVYCSLNRRRLQRGITVFLKGLKEDSAIARLHQFVRAVEAVVKPAPPGIKARMVKRCRIFTGGDPNAESVIGECYELRSKEEHLLDWEDALAGYPQHQREGIVHQRVREAEALTRHIYFRILTSPAHLTDFEDAAIDGFWSRPEADRMARWGVPLDILSVH